MIVQSLAAHSDKTRLCAVRFSENVMGSSGSVIPLFQEQINKREAIYVTDPDAERYFMTIEEAAQLIIQAGAMGSKGEIFFYLIWGENLLKILEIAKKMVSSKWLGYQRKTEKGDIEIVLYWFATRRKTKRNNYIVARIFAPTEHPKN